MDDFEKEVQRRRREQLSKLRESIRFRERWMEEGAKDHAANMAVRREREKRDLRFELTLQEKHIRKRKNATIMARADMQRGIQEFERTLDRFGRISQVTEDKGVLEAGEMDSETMRREAQAFMNRIKRKKAQETMARKEREQRRRKVMVEQQRLFREIEEKRRREILVERLQRKSQEERKTALEIMKAQKWKEIMIENRIAREKQQEEKRRQAQEEEIRMFRELEEAQRAQREERTRLLQKRYEEAQRRRRQEKYMKRYALCKEAVDHMIDLCILEIDYVDRMEGARPPDSLRNDWHTLFLQSKLLIVPEEPTNEADEEHIDSATGALEDNDLPSADSSDTLDEYELDNYIMCRESWTPPIDQEETPGDEPPALFSPHISRILEGIELRINPPPARLGVDIEGAKSKVQIRIAILGKPFSGKTSIASRLEQELNIYRIDPFEIAQRTVSQERQGEPSDLQNHKATDKYEADIWDEKLEQLLISAKSETSDSSAVSPSVLVNICLNEIDRAENGSHSWNGWILDGFPDSVETAAALEEVLSGYRKCNYQPRRSRLVPPAAVETLELASMGQSSEIQSGVRPGVKYLLIVDATDEVVFKRIADCVVDPETRTVYHALHKPPPRDEAVMKRLVPYEETNVDHARLNETLIGFETLREQLSQWYRNIFAQVVHIDGSERDLDAIVGEIVPLLTASDESHVERPLRAEGEERDVEEGTDVVDVDQERIEGLESATVHLTTQEENNETAKNENIRGDELSDSSLRKHISPSELDIESARLYASSWFSMEDMYVKGIKGSLRSIRQDAKKLQVYLEQTKLQFSQFLKKPDRKQEHLTYFQLMFNEIRDDMRSNDEVKQELHRKTDGLKQTLWGISDDSKEQAEEKLEELRSERWISVHKRQVALQYLYLAQLEVTRYLHTHKFLTDVYHEMYGKLMEPIDTQILQQMLQYAIIPTAESDEAESKSKSSRKKTAKTAAPSGKKATKSSHNVGGEEGDEIGTLVESVIQKGKLAPQHLASIIEHLSGKDKPKRGGGKKTKDKKKTAGGTDGSTEDLSVIEELEEAIELENKILFQRLDMIATRCMRAMSEIDSRSEHVLDVMEEWIGQRYLADAKAISDLAYYIQSAIEMEKSLSEELLLTVEGFQVGRVAV